MTDWNELISDVVAGHWKDPATGKTATVPFEVIRIEDDLDGGEADMLAPLNLGKRIAVVSDVNTHEAMGRRVAKHLKGLGTIDELVLPGNTHCDEPTIAMVQEKTRHADAIVAVGSGALSDTCKFATFKDGRKYATFGTAASMNGYAASTASVTLANGYKTSLPAHAPRGIFLDLKVSAKAPHWLSVCVHPLPDFDAACCFSPEITSLSSVTSTFTCLGSMPGSSARIRIRWGSSDMSTAGSHWPGSAASNHGGIERGRVKRPSNIRFIS